MKTEDIIGWGALGLLGYIIYVNNKTDKVEFQRVGEGVIVDPDPEVDPDPVIDPPWNTADFDNDGVVGTDDLIFMISEFGTVCEDDGIYNPQLDPECLADLNGDNSVTQGDLLIFLGAFGMTQSQALQWIQNHSINCDYSTDICIA
tara:strand:- start:166 stop:603 length:438 start_codon:yes stop_codon:yes gene_type:complete